MSDTTLSELEGQREHLKLQLAELGDLRPGSLVERYRKCGKPNCHCAETGQPGHGPSWSLTHDAKGKTVTRIIPAGFVPDAQSGRSQRKNLRCADIERQAGRRFKKKLHSPLNWPPTPPLKSIPCWAAAPRMAWISKPSKTPHDARCWVWLRVRLNRSSMRTCLITPVRFWLANAAGTRAMPGAA